MSASKPLPKSMAAWQHSPAYLSSGDLVKNLTLNQTAPVPSLGKNQTLIKVLSASINPVDYKLGELPFAGRLAVGSPSTPGIDFVGHVWATNVKDADFKPGDLVVGKTTGMGSHGSLADFTVVAGTDAVIKAPQGVDVDQLAVMPVVGLTAFQSLVPYLETNGEGSAKGKSVFINGGSGGVGTFAIQIAKILGCAKVVVSCSGANVELVKGLGADHVVDYRSVDVADGMTSWIKSDNNEEKFDLFIDAVCHDLGLYYKAHHYLKPEAKYVFLGGDITLANVWDLVKLLATPGFLGGGKRKFVNVSVVSKKADFEKLARWMQEGKIKAMIDSEYSKEDAVAAYKRLKTGRTRGKIVVRMSEDGRS